VLSIRPVGGLIKYYFHRVRGGLCKITWVMAGLHTT
jgi:hypothetical protein